MKSIDKVFVNKTPEKEIEYKIKISNENENETPIKLTDYCSDNEKMLLATLSNNNDDVKDFATKKDKQKHRDNNKINNLNG